MSKQQPVPGQRWVSDSEPELGLGIILQIAAGRVEIMFPAASEHRQYALATAPLRRVVFKEADKIKLHSGAEFVVDRTAPGLRLDTPSGWTNQTEVQYRVDDAGAWNSGWRLWSEGEPEPTTWDYVGDRARAIPLPAQGNWTLRLAAEDLAGNAPPSLRTTFRIAIRCSWSGCGPCSTRSAVARTCS